MFVIYMVIFRMNRSLIILGAIFCVFLMVSSATAIPQKQSDCVMNKINILEDMKLLIENKILDISVILSSSFIDFYSTGFIENLINFLIRLIEFILNIVNFIGTIINLGENLLSFINQIIYIIETIINIINWLLDLINPESFTV